MQQNNPLQQKPMLDREARLARIRELEDLMNSSDFWTNPDTAQNLIKELKELKLELEGGSKYDQGSAILTIFSGAGGDDAEDFSTILLRMYRKYAENKGWGMTVLNAHENDHGGYRNIMIEISGKNVYGTLKNESGIHRLVRISPFNAKGQRHTSFSLVEVVPKFDKVHADDIAIPEKDLEISIAKSGGPGGQNVNKRETAVRIVHIPTKLSVHVTSERSQAQNKEKALEILKAKIYRVQEEERKKREQGLFVSKTTDIEWGNQIRSYVMHPYKMVKDHRTNVETSSIDEVLEGEIDLFIEAEKGL